MSTTPLIPGTETNPTMVTVDVECFIRHADRIIPRRTLEISIDLKELFDGIDRNEWEYDDLDIEWCEGSPFVHVSFRPNVEDEDLWEDELEDVRPQD
jgi:hypothetical protein